MSNLIKKSWTDSIAGGTGILQEFQLEFQLEKLFIQIIYIPCIGAEDGVWEDGVSGVTNGYEVVLEADLNVLRRWSPGGPSAKPVMKPK